MLSSDGCGRPSTKVASWSPLTATSLTFWYQIARGFLRKSSAVSLPVSLFQVHCTSLAVNGLPSCHFTPWRSLNVSLVLVVVPGPALGQVGNDGLGRVELLALVEHHQVVEDRHERLHRRDGRFLVDGAARQIVAVVDAERAALLLGQRRWQRPARCENNASATAQGKLCAHGRPPTGPPLSRTSEDGSSRQPQVLVRPR